jgi:hypothetical protein
MQDPAPMARPVPHGWRWLVAGLLTVVLAAALVLTDPSRGEAGVDDVWTAAGSTGTVDEADQEAVKFTGTKASVKGKAIGQNGTVVLRYNVVATADLVGGVPYLAASFNDEGNDGNVLVKLKQSTQTTGATETLLTLDSNSSPAGYQTAAVADCNLGPFSFASSVYFVEVRLERSNIDNDVQIGALRVQGEPCT